MPVDRLWRLPLDHYDKPKVSAVITTRNEHPVLYMSIFSILEELQHWGYPVEFVIVSNLDTDLTPDILECRFGHWLEIGRMRVVRFNEKASVDVARNRGAEAATGDVVLFSDAHVSYKIGTLHGMIQGWLKHGGMWHTCINCWGDTEETRLYAYELTLEQNFWGTQGFAVPGWAWVRGDLCPYTVPMAGYAAVVVGREAFWEVGGFHEGFRCYAGGESYLSLKWWLFGKQAWLFPDGLVRHDNLGVHIQLSDEGKLYFGRRYSWTNDDYWFNLMLAAYTIGGEVWLEQIHERIRRQCNSVTVYLKNVQAMRDSVVEVGREDRERIVARQQTSLDDLLEREPWNIH